MAGRRCLRGDDPAGIDQEGQGRLFQRGEPGEGDIAEPGEADLREAMIVASVFMRSVLSRSSESDAQNGVFRGPGVAIDVDARPNERLTAPFVSPNDDAILLAV